jgi:voltage-gated potassium channel Kch
LDDEWDEDPTHEDLPDPEYHPFKIFLLYIFSFMCIIDVITIGPVFAELFSRESISLAVIRVIRLVRLYKIFKGTRFAASVEAFIITMRKSLLALSVLILFTALGSIVFASVMYILEGGDFTVNDEYPNGAYLRPGLTPGDSQPSPFVSIASALYWACVTVTTVGYGDMYPTTTAGRFFSMIWMFCGVMLIALPVSVLGSNFSATLAEMEEKSRQKPKKNLVGKTIKKWRASLAAGSGHGRYLDSSSSGHLDKSLLTEEDRQIRMSATSGNISLREIKREPQQNPLQSGTDLLHWESTHEPSSSLQCCVTCPNCSSSFVPLPLAHPKDRLKYLSGQIDLLINELQEEKRKFLDTGPAEEGDADEGGVE